jgi:hypothetical protein
MTRIEQRRLDRYPLQRQPDGKLRLRTADGRHAIVEIRDISDFGISFYLEDSLDVSAKVAIEYADPKLKLEVYGRVAWCAARPVGAEEDPPSRGFVLGVELISPMMLFAVLQKH